MVRRHWTNRRGAALLLAISMMMLLALLGTTFMFVTRSYRQYSQIIESRGPVELLANGIVKIISKEMQRDMWGPPLGSIDKDGFPYKTILDGPPGAPSLRRRFGDYAGPQASTKHFSEDFWLSTFNVREAGSHASNLGLGTYSLTTHLKKSKMNAQTGSWLAPNNKPENDAVWQNTYVLNSMGHTYFVAPRVIDLCGLLNVNTAGVIPATTPPFITPVDIDINTVVRNGLSIIEAERGSNVTSEVGREAYFWNVAARLHTPGGGKPFCIGDEPAARVPLSADSGLRLAQMLKGMSIYDRTLVTPYSSNRNFLRRNKDDARQRINPNISYLRNFYPNLQALDALDINNSSVRDGLYPQLVEAITNPDRSKAAALKSAEEKAQHLLANLWAYCDNMQPSKEYAFIVDGKTVYGVVPRPVIAEAYIYHRENKQEDSTKDDSYQAYAVEIFNPTDAPVDLAEYKLGSMALSGTIGVNKRMVFYSHQSGSDAADNKKDLAKIFQNVSQAGWVNLPALDFSKSITLKLKKGDIPVDAVKTGDFDNYKKKSDGNYGPKAIQRDDSWDNPLTPYLYEGRERYNVAIWATRTTNKLGKANNIGHGPISLNQCVEGFNIVKKRKLSNGDYICPSVGELCHLFATGPVKNGKSLPEKLKTGMMYQTNGTRRFIRMSDHRGKAVPSFDSHRGSIPYCVGGPWPCVLAEFVDVVPPDPTRNISHIVGKDVYAVQYGKINVNTASAQVLRSLPYPSGSFRFGVKGSSGARVSGLTIGIARAIGTKIKARAVDLSGLKTPGQVLVDVRDKISFLAKEDKNRIGFVHAYARFGPIVDVLTVSSDSFAVVLKLAATDNGLKPAGDEGNVVGTWRYLAVIDRSNCMNATDSPQIMLFMPLD